MQVITVGSLLLLLFVLGTSPAGANTEPLTALKNKSMPKTISTTAATKELSNMNNFVEQQSAALWHITNDGVMGGKSQGQFLVEQGKAVFNGNISLDNNGGFSSVFRTIDSQAKGLETVTIDVQGDGLTYQLRLAVNLDGYRLSYKHEFKTVEGQRDTLTFTLADFQASFRGRHIDNAPTLKSEDIREVGFLVTNKLAGEFSLSIFSLNF